MGRLDARFFKPFVDGTLNTLRVQCFVDATPLKPYIKGTQPQAPFELAGSIGITSEAFTGSIVICFPEAFFLVLMGNMLGETFQSINEDLQSGAAELLNIIFGSAKVALNAQGHSIQKAIPTVIRGSRLQTTHLGSGPVMVLPFTSAVGDFNIEISTEEKSLC